MNDKLDISELNITDEMVKEFLKNFSFGSTQLSNWEKFKQSKIYAKKERITVTHLWQHDTFKGNDNDAFWYQFCTSQPIEHIRNSKIKYAIEDVINPNKEYYYCHGAKIPFGNQSKEEGTDWVGEIFEDQLWLSISRKIKTVKINHQKYFSQSEVNSIWDAARNLTANEANPHLHPTYKTLEDYLKSLDKENFRVKEDMICPITKEHCDDECCTVGSICNASNNEPQPVTETPSSKTKL